MATEKVMELLNAIQTDPKAKELLKDAAQPRSEEEMIRLCAELAPQLGYDVNEAEIREAITAAAQARREKTAADIQALPDDDVEKAVGGGNEDTFWTGEDAPDGHEMGCMLTYHTYQWQKDNDTWCKKEFYCSNRHYSQDPCLELNYCIGVVYK